MASRRRAGRGAAVALLAVVLGSFVGAFGAFADGALAHPPEFVETGADRLFGITVCPEGYAVEGLQLAKRRLLCRADGLGKADVFADYSTQGGGMHACPDGTYVRGYDVTGNILVCSFDISVGATRFASGDIRSPAKGGGAPQRFGMHVCSKTDFSQVVVAVHASDNTFLCRQLPPAQPAGPIVVPASFDPTRARGLAPFGPFTSAQPSVPFWGDISTWRTITLNWLTHILNLPMPGTTGDPRCIRLPGELRAARSQNFRECVVTAQLRTGTGPADLRPERLTRAAQPGVQPAGKGGYLRQTGVRSGRGAPAPRRVPLPGSAEL